MNNRAIAIIMSPRHRRRLPSSRFRPSDIGGIKEQTPLAAPAKQTPLGGPVKPISVAGPVKPKPTAPVVAITKPASATVSPSPLKCPAPCVAKGPH